MNFKEIAIRIADRMELAATINLLTFYGVPINPSGGDPRVEVQDDGSMLLFIYATPRIEKLLKQRNYEYDVIKDFASERDPREFVSKTNRFKKELEALKRKKLEH